MRCLVADDDPLVCETVESFLSRIEGVEFCLKANDGLTALNLLSAGGFDAVFLDLQMPGLDGQTLLKALPKELPVVVISASTDFGARSYEFNVADYLVKPLEFSRFFQAVQKIRDRLQQKAPSAGGNGAPEEIFVKDSTKIQKITLRDLLLVKAEANYVDFIMEERSVLSLMSMKRIEEQLPANFVRVHRSYIVNKNRINRIEDGMVIIGQHKVPIGDSYREELMRSLRIIS